MKSVDLLITTMESDPSGFRFDEEAKKLGLNYQFHYLSQLSPNALPIPRLPVGDNTRYLPRRPYHSNNVDLNYFSLFDLIYRTYSFKKTLDHGLWQKNYLSMADKLTKQAIFEDLNLPIAPLVNPLEENLEFPLIAKKRLAARATANYLLEDFKAFKTFITKYHPGLFVFQRFFPLKADFRVLVIGGKVFGAVERTVSIKKGGKLGIKVVGPAKLEPHIEAECLKITQAVGADVLGIDVGLKKAGGHFFIEYNYSPQFLGFERETGLNAARAIIEWLME